MSVVEDPDQPDRRPRVTTGHGEVYIGPAGSDGNDLAGWTDLGWIADDTPTTVFPEQDPTLDRYALNSLTLSITGEQSAEIAAIYDRLRADAQQVNDDVERRARASRQSARRTARATGPAKHVDEVLADVDAAAEGRCACGCGRAITARSPSAYYATAGCQHTWMARHVDNPHDVYDRPDAAVVGYDDGGHIPLSGHIRPTGGYPPGYPAPYIAMHAGHVHLDLRADPDPAPGPAPGPGRAPRWASRWISELCRLRDGQVYGPGYVPAELAYHRDCPACDTRMIPNLYEDDEEDITLFGEPSQVVMPRRNLRQECSRCQASLAGPLFIPAVTPDPVDYDTGTDGTGWTLHLSNHHSRVATTLTRAALDAHSPDRRRAIVDNMWASMERDLDRFDREWRGRVAALHRHHLEAEQLAARLGPDAVIPAPPQTGA
jgi:hypothetical protein